MALPIAQPGELLESCYEAGSPMESLVQANWVFGRDRYYALRGKLLNPALSGGARASAGAGREDACGARETREGETALFCPILMQMGSVIATTHRGKSDDLRTDRVSSKIGQ
jgi:hypothetical protein